MNFIKGRRADVTHCKI